MSYLKYSFKDALLESAVREYGATETDASWSPSEKLISRIDALSAKSKKRAVSPLVKWVAIAASAAVLFGVLASVRPVREGISALFGKTDETEPPSFTGPQTYLTEEETDRMTEKTGNAYPSTEPETEVTTQETTAPGTSAPETTAQETTVPETTPPETAVPETTLPETTVPETTAHETKEPETTPPETTEPETTIPETAAPVPVIRSYDPDEFDKNGYRLAVNGKGITPVVKFNAVEGEPIILPFSQIMSYLNGGEARIFTDSFIRIVYGDSSFAVNATYKKSITSQAFEGNWLDGKLTENSVLFLHGTAKTNGVLYADVNIVNAFLAEFTGGGVTVDTSTKTIDVRDGKYKEETIAAEDKHALPFAEGMFFVKTPVDDTPGFYDIAVYVNAEDDGGRSVKAFTIRAADGARLKIAAAKNENGSVEFYSWLEELVIADENYKYISSALQNRVSFVMVYPDAAEPYRTRIDGESARIEYSEQTKDKMMKFTKIKIQTSTVEFEAAELHERAAAMNGVITVYESDGETDSYMKAFDADDVFTLKIARENGLFD